MRAAVVGCGSIGGRYARWLAEESGVEVGVFDRAPDRMQAHSGYAKSFRDLDELSAWHPRLVIVATPPHSHLAAAGPAVESGAYVLIEKPIDAQLDHARAFAARYADSADRIRVVCNMRFHPAIQALAQALPRVGNPLFTRAHFGHALWQMRPGVALDRVYASDREQGGGVIFDCIHEIDYHQWMFGPIRDVRGSASQLVLKGFSAEDHAVVEITFASGVRAVLLLDFIQRVKRRGCEIVGSEGTLIWESEGRSPEVAVVRLLSPEGSTTLFSDDAVDSAITYRTMLRRALQAAAGGRDEGLQTVAQAISALDAAMRASEGFVSCAADAACRTA